VAGAKVQGGIRQITFRPSPNNHSENGHFPLVHSHWLAVDLEQQSACSQRVTPHSHNA